MRPDQWSVDWLIAVLNGFQIREEVKLRAIDVTYLSKPIKMALRTRDILSLVPEELLQWIKSLNPGFHTENWRVLDSNEDPTGRRPIVIVDQDSATVFKRPAVRVLQGCVRHFSAIPK